MCTAIVRKGSDLVYGFNLDIDPSVWDYRLIKNRRYFAVGITVGSTTYLTHGVNAQGKFGVLPYMNGEGFEVPRGSRRVRIDLLNDRWLRGKYSFEEVERLTEERVAVNIPMASLHGLLASPEGELLIVEPGYGVQRLCGTCAVLSNFPVLAGLSDFSNPFYGKDRYDRAAELLEGSRDDFSATDALNVLRQVKQEGRWGTKISFAYSCRERAVWYCLDGDFDEVQVHRFPVEE